MGEAAPVYAVMAYTVPGMPLLYSGQEAGLNKRLPFFEKDSIDWNVRPELAGFYRQLNDLKRSCPALKAGEHGGAFRILNHDNERSVFVYERKLGDVQVIVMLNLTGEEQRSVLAEEITGSFTEYFSGATAEGLKEITLPAHGYRVWMK